MIIREIFPQEKEQFNQMATHPLQSWEWGKFRENTDVQVFKIGLFDKKNLKSSLQLTIHQLPKTNYTVGYIPKCAKFNKQMLDALKEIGQKHNCLFIKIEPNLIDEKEFFLENGCVYGRPLFTKYTFQVDLTQDKEILLAKMKQKTRYNIKVAQKHQVRITEDNSPGAFDEYLKLTFETTKRQKFYAHDKDYHRKMWQILYPSGMAHLLKATYQGKTLVAWIVFVFNNVLYYPYGASSREHKNIMASTLMMWEAMLFGKNNGCRTFDLWGCLGPNPNKKDPWYGFHYFKQGFNPKLVEFIGTFDLVLNQPIYKIYNLIDSLRWKYLKLKAMLPSS